MISSKILSSLKAILETILENNHRSCISLSLKHLYFKILNIQNKHRLLKSLFWKVSLELFIQIAGKYLWYSGKNNLLYYFR